MHPRRPGLGEGRGVLPGKKRKLIGAGLRAAFGFPRPFEILLPPARRDREFRAGHREFDPKNVGYVDARAPASTLSRVNDDRGRPILGNDNGGHDYGSRRLSDDDRKALVGGQSLFRRPVWNRAKPREK